MSVIDRKWRGIITCNRKEYGCTMLTYLSKVQSCLVNNSPCFWSQSEWSNVLKDFRDDTRTSVRNKWFADNFRLLAHLSTLIADCSELLLVMDRKAAGYYGRRRILIRQIQRVEKMSAKLRMQRSRSYPTVTRTPTSLRSSTSSVNRKTIVTTTLLIISLAMWKR